MENRKTLFFAGNMSIAGAISMLIGAACWGASGTDLWQALATSQMEDYLSQLPTVKQLLIINTGFWILGVLLMATAIILMTEFCISNQGFGQMAKVFSLAGAAAAIVSFIIMLSLAMIVPSVDIATIIGWIGARLDDIATMLIIGFSPLCLSIAGKGNWVPDWLSVWGFLAGISGFLGIVSMLTGIVALGFIIIPFGIGWMIAAGIVLLKKSKSVETI
jgi:hypothetical protein